jgi:hypothetical protein
MEGNKMIKVINKNLNPKGKRTCDCSIQALSNATGYDYYKVYDDLYKMSIKTGWFCNDTRTIVKLIEQYGFIKCKQPRKNDNTKYMVREFENIYNSNALIMVANHITFYDKKENAIIDAHGSCLYKTIGNYYIKE